MGETLDLHTFSVTASPGACQLAFCTMSEHANRVVVTIFSSSF